MSTPAARPFLPALRELDDRLEVPVPDRVRILRELEYDLEELQDRLVTQGLPAEEARGRALEALLPDAVTVHALGRVHAPRYRRLTRHLRSDRLVTLERSALVLVTASVLLTQTWLLLRTPVLESPSPFLWPVLLLGALLCSAILANVFELWIKRDHRASDRGFGGILALAGITLAAGIGGTMLDIQRLAAVLERSPELAGTLAPVWLVRDSALLAVALLLALAGGLTWFVLTQWLAMVSETHRRVLGVGPLDNPGKEKTE